MSTEKLFGVAGVSKLDGQFKVRYANNMARAKVLEKNGHTDIKFIDFGGDLRAKVDAVDELLKHDLGSEAANAAVIAEAREYGFLV
jgi:hypothetical protein